ERIRRMGEPEATIHTVGSPAIDDLDRFPPLDDEAWTESGAPGAVVLLHPIGRHAEEEEAAAAAVLEGARQAVGDGNVLALPPNADPGREGVTRAIESAATRNEVLPGTHMPRERFVGLLRRLAQSRAVLVGNSSAGLIEAAALAVPTVNVGPRQAGRERAGNVVDVPRESAEAVAAAIAQARERAGPSHDHPYGDGHAGQRIADLLATTDPHAAGLTRKHCAY
ncbi:MAG: UDP-N-acetylglucosamine 2-epimerase, partial [Myxococcales bacterium]|nr:UDP-N-acetylglucosamine 2-epimerase [Myxococcales bacterium]